MADVKWIKLATNLFDNRKIRQIECLPEGYAIIVVWVKLLCLAGNINDSGFVYFTREIPYTDQMLAQQFNIPLTTVQLALKVFEQFGMIEVVDNILHISNWEKYQNIEGLDKIREQNRLRQAKFKAKQKQLPGNVTGNVTVTQGNATEEERDKEEDKEKELSKESKRETTLTLFARLSSEYSFSSELKDKLADWFKYKTERKEPYREQGMKSLLTQIGNKVNEYGEQAVVNLIDECMASGWKGIIFDRLTKTKRTEVVPKWMKKQEDYNPAPERIKKSGDWLDGFLEEQKQAELQARAEQLKQRIGG